MIHSAEPNFKLDNKQSVGVVRSLLYTSARILSLDLQAYEEYVLSCAEDNPFLDVNLEEMSNKNQVSKSLGFMEEEISQKVSLQDVLLEQWRVCILPNGLYSAGKVVISNLSEQGFHSAPLEALVTEYHTLEMLDKAATIISRFDPVGCATKDWIESIWIQSLERPLYSGWSRIGLERFRQAILYLKDDAHKLHGLRILGIEDEEELRQYLSDFAFYPGLKYASSSIMYRKTDLVLSVSKEGLKVLLSSCLEIDRLSLDYYQRLLEQVKGDAKAISWLHRLWREAGDILAMHRYRTAQLLRVSTYIVTYQHNYLLQSGCGLKPLQLSDISAALMLSVSSVSRIIKDKYLLTPKGVIALKQLLSRKQQHKGEVYSREQIQHKVESIIYQYGTIRISDAKISRILALEGINLSRRTINKYRHKMHK